MEPSSTALCAILLLSSGFCIKGQEWTCPPNSTRVFVRQIQKAELRFDVDPPASIVNYKVWSPTGDTLLTAAYVNSSFQMKVVNNTYCTSVDSENYGYLYIILKEGNMPGVYRLEKSPGGSKAEKCITVYILGIPNLPTISKVKDSLSGENVTVTCNSTSTTAPSNHSLSIAYDWVVNSVENPTEIRFTYSSRKQTITITNVTRQDFGTQITCTATEEVTNGYTSDNSSTVQISVIHGPDPCKNLLLLYEYKEGDSLPEINCSSACYPGCVYNWTSKSGVVGTTGVLSLRNISRDWAGNYSFTASNTALSYDGSFQTSFQVVVKYAPVVTIRFSTTDHSEGSSLTLYCEGKGVPATYVHTGLMQTVGEVEIPNNNKLTETNSYIHFPSLRLEDTGNYTCKINNGITDINGILDQVKTAEIHVQIKPKVLQTSLLFAGAVGGSVLVQVPFYCYPPVAAVKLRLNNSTEIKTSVKYNISNVEYTVNDTFYGKRVMLPGFQSHMTITDLTEKDFVNYSLTLNNSKGTTNVTVIVIAEGIPSLPKSFEYLLVFGRQMLIWEKGFNGGHPQSFHIQTSILSFDDWKKWTTVSENDEKFKLNDSFYSVELVGLKPGIYTARLVAENSAGQAKPINLTTSFTIVQEDIPGKRSQNVAAVAGGIISSLVVIIAVVIVIFVWKRRTGINENKASHVHLNKHVKTVQEDDSDDDVEVENPMYDSGKKKSQGDENVYAKPNKQKPFPRGADVCPVVGKSKTPQNKKKEKLTATKLAAEDDIYDNSPTKFEVKNTYGNAAFGDIALETTEESTSQTNKGNGNKGGLVYADLAFAARSKGKKPPHISLDERTPYAQVDFQKRGDPLPDSDSEEPKKTSKY